MYIGRLVPGSDLVRDLGEGDGSLFRRELRSSSFKSGTKSIRLGDRFSLGWTSSLEPPLSKTALLAAIP